MDLYCIMVRPYSALVSGFKILLYTKTERQHSYQDQLYECCQAKNCNCGKMCENTNGLKIHKKSQMPNTRKQVNSSIPKCFISLQNVILASLLIIVLLKKHLTTLSFQSQIVRNQLLATNAMKNQKTFLSIYLLNIQVMASTSVVERHVAHTTFLLVTRFLKVICLAKNTRPYEREE